jgi:hypothetical protein
MPRSNKSILFRHLGEQEIEPLVEHLEPRHFRVTQVDDDAGAIGGLDSRLAEPVAQADRPGCGCALRVVRL